MMRTMLARIPPQGITGNRLRQRAMRRAFAHGALLWVPIRGALATSLR